MEAVDEVGGGVVEVEGDEGASVDAVLAPFPAFEVASDVAADVLEFVTLCLGEGVVFGGGGVDEGGVGEAGDEGLLVGEGVGPGGGTPGGGGGDGELSVAACHVRAFLWVVICFWQK